MPDRLPRKLRFRLSDLWLLEWGITGALLTYLPLSLTQNGLTLHETGPALAIGAIGQWMSPIWVGKLSDRWSAARRCPLPAAIRACVLPGFWKWFRLEGEPSLTAGVDSRSSLFLNWRPADFVRNPN